MNKIVRNTFFISISELATKGLLTISTIILVRALTPDGYGIYTFAQSLTMLFVVLIHIGFFTVGVREVAKFPERTQIFADNITFLKIIGVLISFLLLFVALLLIEKPQEIKIAYAFVAVYIFAVIFNFDWVFRGHDRMEIPALSSILQGVLMVVLTFLFVKTSADFPKAILIYSVSYLISFIFLTFVYLKDFGVIKPKYDRAVASELLKSALPISTAWLVVVVYGNISIFMINFLTNNFETGIYGAMNKLMLLLLLPNSILQGAFFPEVSRSILKGNFEDVQKNYHRIVFLVGSYFIFAVLSFPSEIILLFFGEKYLVGIPILQVSMGWVILSYFSATLTNSLMALERQSDFFKATIIGGIISIIASYFFVKKFGALGGMFTGILTEGAVVSSLYFFYKKLKRKTNYIESFKSIGLGLFLFVIITTTKNSLGLYLSVLAYFVIFPILAFLTRLIKLSDLQAIIRK
ncbi:MAG: oligosaccharide flippase family protein [Candidatus Kapaibacteriales bacterium]